MHDDVLCQENSWFPISGPLDERVEVLQNECLWPMDGRRRMERCHRFFVHVLTVWGNVVVSFNYVRHILGGILTY